MCPGLRRVDCKAGRRHGEVRFLMAIHAQGIWRYVRVLVLQGRSHLRKVSGRVRFIDQGKGTYSELALFLA